MEKLFIMGNKKIWFTISALVIAIGLVGMFMNFQKTGSLFNLGIDFTGGTSLLIKVDSVTAEFEKTGKLSNKLKNETIAKILAIAEKKNIKNVQVNTADKYLFLIRTSLGSGESNEKEKVLDFQNNIKSSFGQVEILESDFIGPTIGYELQQQSFWIILVAVVLLLIYITFRFEFWAGLAAIAALFHDALVVLGMTALLHIEVNTAYVAAILTILGYSINDTIVIFDRIRENTKDMQKEGFAQIIEQSIKQTIVRSINTSMTTLVVLLAIYVFGGLSLKDFSLTLFIGILSGTYSSIFVASPILNQLKRLR